MVNSLIFT